MTTYLVTCRTLLNMTGQLVSVGVVPEGAAGITPIQLRVTEVAALIEQGSRFVIRVAGAPESRLTVHKDVVGHKWVETVPDATKANNLGRLPECAR